jgi:hypothetical protein
VEILVSKYGIKLKFTAVGTGTYIRVDFAYLNENKEHK